MPPQDDKFDSTPLTDPVAPILSEPETPTQPINPPLPIEPKPATLPPINKPPVVTILLIVISISAVALTSFLYIQSQRLNSQLNTLSQTLDNQKTKVTPTPTPTVILTPTLVITPEASISASPTVSPTVVIKNVWGDISSVMNAITPVYPKAQLLMVDAQYVQPGNELVVKYWFRQDETTKKYAYVLKDNSKDMSLVDQQVYLTPDNNIPSLNKAVADKALGIEFDKAILIAKTSCPATFDCLTANISGKFIRNNTTLWQITMKQADKVFVVQIDSLTEKVLYKSQ